MRVGHFPFVQGCPTMTSISLADLGWSDFFARQGMSDTETPMRVSAVHREAIEALSPDGVVRLLVPEGTGTVTPGDWVLTSDAAVTRVLERRSLLKRRAAGEEAREQLLAANVGTLGIVTSCNADFNVARLERYLVMAADAGCIPLIILTKSDLTDDPADYVRIAERLSPLVTAIAINATDPDDVARLAPWVRAGETLALLGSSGVGKTTIRNALTQDAGATQAIRDDDAKGRHTTTSRALLATRFGGWLIDTPGMRAVRLADVAGGVAEVFADIEDLVAACRFSDCAHDVEPGCAVLAAIAAGDLEADRVRRWRKLLAEDARNTESIAQARSRDKGFGKMVKGAMARKRKERGS